jgi:hypothetical protein
MGDELDIDTDLGDDFGDEGGEDLGDEFGDTVSVDLPRDVAEQLHSALGDMLGGGEDEIMDIEDTGDEGGLGGDDLEFPESHVELVSAPDSVSGLTGMNNKVGGDGHTPGGGSADSSARGQEDGGKPKAQPDGKGKLQGMNNKVGGKITGGNKNMFKA